MKRTQDRAVQYQLQMDEEGILLAAATILEQRLQRQGRIHSPTKPAITWLPAALTCRTRFSVSSSWTTSTTSWQPNISSAAPSTAAKSIPRVVAKRALELNAVAVILFHNHPSGNPEPSEADRKVTQRLQEALGLLDIRVLDHLVIGGQKSVSLAARGWA
ncbi:DNA repair protein RadC [Xanthomonas arboricola]|nr:DNA repair protein RadC [Xanthomonas cannabis]NIK62723.1 DNA repair protein RadC [Xanthomonas cannabis]